MFRVSSQLPLLALRAAIKRLWDLVEHHPHQNRRCSAVHRGFVCRIVVDVVVVYGPLVLKVSQRIRFADADTLEAAEYRLGHWPIDQPARNRPLEHGNAKQIDAANMEGREDVFGSGFCR